MRQRVLTLVGAVCALVAASCEGVGTREDSSVPRTGGEDRMGPARAGPLRSWSTYHHDGSQSGYVATGPRQPLRRAWARRLVGAVYGEPLVVGSTLVVATERNYGYGLKARTGATSWRSRRLGTPQRLNGLPCGDVDPLGITGTPAYDRATGSVFAAAETSGGTHTLWALSAANGHRRWHRSLDTQKHRRRLGEQQRAAVLVSHGKALVAFGGLAGDCDNYVGYVVSVATNGRGRSQSYAVPTPREGGIWTPPGPVAGFHGNVYVSIGNGAKTSGRWDHSDSVTELTPARLRRVSAFAPRGWRTDNRDDFDLGSSAPVIVKAAHRVVIAGKRGVVYLLRPSLGGIGSAVRQLGARSLTWRWRRAGVYSSPVVAGRRVYVADQTSGDLVVLALSDGRILGRYHAGPMPHFPSQVVSGSWVFVPTVSGVTAFMAS